MPLPPQRFHLTRTNSSWEAPLARISLKQVVVEFPIISGASRSLQLRLYQALGGRLSARHRTVVVRALDGIDLELYDGDRLGLIGDNGSGKTTLLRVLAGVYSPGRGTAEIEGSISSFTDITLGMDPESYRLGEHHLSVGLHGIDVRGSKAALPSDCRFFRTWVLS